jgi:ferric-dicitrate binding protein FerR (iron transport regulator)
MMKNLLSALTGAALLLLSAACSQDDPTTYRFKTAADQRVALALSDESQLRVNAGAGLDYDAENFDRVVKLDGETFFKVKKTGEPFTIETPNGIIVVPSQADVNVWSRGDLLEVSIFGGSAELRTRGNKLVKKVLTGQAIRTLNGKIDLEWVIELPASPSWVIGKSEFNNVPFSYVIRELELQFGLTVQPNNVNVQQRYTGGFINADLNTALNMVFSDQGIQYELVDNSVIRLIQ